MAKAKDADTAPMGVEELVEAFSYLLLSDKQAAMSAMEEVLAADISQRKAQLMAELQALGGIPAAAAKPTRQRTPLPEGDARAAVKAQFKGPNGETWSARGATPKWLRALEEAGHNREEYRIKD